VRVARERYESQARSLLERAAKILRGEELSLVTVEEEVYQNIAAAREPLNPHPDESFRAGMALCAAALTEVSRKLPSGSPLQEVVGICLVIEETVIDRISRVIMASHVDYLLTKIRETQFEERRRFSRELHDRLAHSMATVKGSLELYETLKERNPSKAEARLRLAQETTDEAIELMREFSGELRGTEASAGLRIALENLVRISVPQRMAIEISFEGEEAHLLDYVRDQLYMILREGIRNVLSHSEAEQMAVEVSITPQEVRTSICDHGIGFDPEGEIPSEGIGLASMRERASLLGGALEIHSGSGEGTEIEVRLPLVRRR
jgi:signal transduction histidine kinase